MDDGPFWLVRLGVRLRRVKLFITRRRGDAARLQQLNEHMFEIERLLNHIVRAIRSSKPMRHP